MGGEFYAVGRGSAEAVRVLLGQMAGGAAGSSRLDELASTYRTRHEMFRATVQACEAWAREAEAAGAVVRDRVIALEAVDQRIQALVPYLSGVERLPDPPSPGALEVLAAGRRQAAAAVEVAKAEASARRATLELARVECHRLQEAAEEAYGVFWRACREGS